MLNHRRQPLRRLVHKSKQSWQPIERLSTKTCLIDFSLRRQNRSDHRRLGTEDGPKALLRLKVQVAIEDRLALLQRLVGYALKRC